MILQKLRATGLKFVSEGDTLVVEPRGCITDQIRAMIRSHKHSILHELARERLDFRGKVIAATEAARLGDFGTALRFGRLCVCANCEAFQFASEPAGLGHCARFGVETWPFVPFCCSCFKGSSGPGRA